MTLESALRLPLCAAFSLRDPSVKLLAPGPEDEPFLSLLDRQERGIAYASLGLPGPLLDQIVTTHSRAQTDGYFAQYKNAERLIIRRNGEPIGRLWLALEGSAFNRALRLIDLVLREEVRGMGIGRDLLCSIVDSARDMRLERVTLSVFAGNEGAIRLCKRIGFRSQGATDDTGNISMVYPLR